MKDTTAVPPHRASGPPPSHSASQSAALQPAADHHGHRHARVAALASESIGGFSPGVVQILMDLAGSVAMELRADGRIVLSSEASAQLLEYPREFLQQRRLFDLVHPEDAEAARHCLLDAVRSGSGGATVRMLKGLTDWLWVALKIRRCAEDDRGAPRLALWGQDITQLKTSEEQLRDLALRDPLTQLGNRALLKERIAEAIADGAPFAVGLLDLDGFKRVNDSLGHGVGDGLLKAAAERLTAMLHGKGLAARTGGDEFVIVLARETTDPQALHSTALRILTEIARPFRIQGQLLHITTSLGFALYPDHGTTEETLLKHADLAMYKAKASGKNTVVVFTEALASEQAFSLSMENGIYEGMRKGEFCLYYQPICDTFSGAVRGVEALMRWNRDGRVVGPGEFIALAEQSAVISLLGEWALRTACMQLTAWDERGYSIQYMSVNVSPRQFMSPGFVQAVQNAIACAGIEGGRLMLEITETTLAKDPVRAAEILYQLRETGAQLAIDDFGTGYSSLSYLKTFPLSVLKIDRSFIKDMLESPSDQKIVAAVLGLARELGMTAVAEGVETEAHRMMLAGKGCPSIQGFLFSRPLPPQELIGRIADGKLVLAS